MNLNETIDGYAADQALRHMAQSEQRKQAKAQRKLIKQERTKILARIDMQEKQRCDKCMNLGSTGSIRDYHCPCPANTEIRRLGNLLENLKNDIETGEYQLKKYDGLTRDDLTLEIYQAMKNENKWSDALIAEKLKWHMPGLTGWKRSHGLVKSPVAKSAPAEVKPIEVDKPTVKITQDVPEQAEEVKSDNEPSEKKNGDTVPAEWYVDLKNKYAIKLRDTQSELQVKESEVARLKIYEKDYRNLEIDLLNEQTENNRLRGVIEDMKSTYLMNQWLMEQHLVLNRRVEEIVGGH